MDEQRIVLVPVPRRTDLSAAARFEVGDGQFVRVAGDRATELLPAARVVLAAVRDIVGGVRWDVVAGGPDAGVAVTIGVDGGVARPQGYRLEIRPEGVVITGHDPAGAFYGAQTFAQVVRQSGGSLACGTIEDWPDFPVRGYMQDVSRDKVPTMATLRALVDALAALKVNQLQLYTEHTFAYRNHREVWAEASPITGREVLELDAYCRERFIELVPNQNSFGHMERWLRHPKYEPLAEKPDGFMFPWGARHEGGFSLNPLDPRSLELVEGLYDELLPHFSSKQFNVGCDETFDLGLGKSRDECDRRGKERVYLEFLNKIDAAVARRGRTMQFWGDIVLHKPEVIPELPKDVIALNWGYDWDHPFEKETKAFADAGVPFYVCPGTSSWLSIGGKTDNAITNLKAAAEHGLGNGAMGYLNTDWGDHGHLQYWPVSWLGMAAGAAYSWAYEANRDLDVATALSAHVFRDAAGVMGQVAFDLGNVYQAVKTPMSMSTRLFWCLVGDAERKPLFERVTAEEWDDSARRVRDAIAPLSGARMNRPDAATVVDEFRNAAAMLAHGARRGKWLLNPDAETAAELGEDMSRIVGEHRRLWLRRNRVGGLQDSTRRLEANGVEYRGASSLRR
jgi:hypothetical protein